MRNLAPTAVATLCTAAAVFALAAAQDGRTSDHLDAPDLTSPDGNLMADIADLFVFPPAGKPNQVVLAATYNPAAGIFGPAGFDPSVDYVFNVDTDGNARADITYTARFAAASNNGRQSYTLWRGGTAIASGTTGRPTALEGGAGRVFAGVRDDPFFFDLDAFLASGDRAFCDGSENDFFAGLNVNAIVIQVPVDELGGGPIGVWLTTANSKDARGGARQIDRAGFPAINTVFIPSKRKNAYNTARPSNDERDFGRFLRRSFKAGGNTTPTAMALTDALLPDILPYDPATAAGFLNGRRLADDVIDAELGLLTAGALTGDCVDINDVPFIATFPYLADAH